MKKIIYKILGIRSILRYHKGWIMYRKNSIYYFGNPKDAKRLTNL